MGQSHQVRKYQAGVISTKFHSSRWCPATSALGQKQTSRHLQPMSALPPKADIETQSRDVRFVPKADIGKLNEGWVTQKAIGEFECGAAHRVRAAERRGLGV
jgi:hypothetical protein